MAEFDPDNPTDALTIWYYYDGASVIEERDGADTLLRYHINGTQRIDERVATWAEAAAKSGGRAGSFTYYLDGLNGNVVGQGDSAGVIERLDYGSGGDFPSGGTPVTHHDHDHDGDGDVDTRDLMNLADCFVSPDAPCLAVHDFDEFGVSDGVIDANDWAGAEHCFSAPGVGVSQDCESTRSRADGLPDTGTFALHGRPIDVLPDGKILYYVRARYYDPEHGRWLQRDPAGYADGANLYESFRGNATRFTDPMGEEAGDWWDPRTYPNWYMAQAMWDTAVVRPAEAVMRVHREDRNARSLGVGEAIGILIVELPGRQIANREISVSSLAGRQPSYSIVHTAKLGALHYGGIDAMSEGLIAFDLTSQQQLSGLEAGSRFFGGLSSYTGTAAVGVGAPQAATQITRTGLNAFSRTGAAKLLSPARRRELAVLAVDIELREGVRAFGRGLASVEAAATAEFAETAYATSLAPRFNLAPVRVYRVESSDFPRVDVGSTGDIAIIGSDQRALYLNFGIRQRAVDFYWTRVSQGGPGVAIKSFDVPGDVLEHLRRISVSERQVSRYPGRPIIGDPTRAPDQYGLRQIHIMQLRNAIIQGTGEVELP